jgi:hypothetical protein
MKIIILSSILLLFVNVMSGFSQSSVKFNRDVFQKNLIGQHGITLHWVGWENRGIIKVTSEDSLLRVVGEQKSKENATDLVRINGTLEVINDKEIKFSGQIITQVSYNNGGEPCEKSGTYTFKKMGNRRYWRLQEMKNCDGVVVDYVDLYF